MLVGVTAAAAAMAFPRSRTRTIACSAVTARAPAAAVSSPTLCPATAPMREKVSAGWGNTSRAAIRPVATRSGWAILVSRMVSASASVIGSCPAMRLTPASGAALSGTLVDMDDLFVTLKDESGATHVVRRVPGLKIVKRDPLQAHHDLLDRITDTQIHDLVAYLEKMK